MEVYLVFGVAADAPWEETLLRVCDSEEAAKSWSNAYLNTKDWISTSVQCWQVSSEVPY